MYQRAPTPSLQCQRVRFNEEGYRKRCDDPSDYLAPKSSLALAGALTASTSSLRECTGNGLEFDRMGLLTSTDFSLKRNERPYEHVNWRLAGVVEEEFNQKRLAAPSRPQIEAESRRKVRELLALCSDFKAMGHGQSCSALFGRARGLDVLYNRPLQKRKVDGPEEEESDNSSSEDDVVEDKDAHVDLPNEASEDRPAAEHRYHHHDNRSDAQLQMIARAKAVLEHSSYFKQVEAQNSGTINKLAFSQGVRFDKVGAGTVFFREQDPGRDCYIVTAGAVDVYKFDYKDVGEEDRTPTPRGNAVGRKPRGKAKTKNSSMAKRLAAGHSPEAAESLPRLQSLEGFSTYNAESTLGDRLASLGPGVHFGELALLSNAPRAATIKSSQDCEVLVISRRPFERIMKHIKEKMVFFTQHFPGLDCNYRGGKHVTTHFHLKSYPVGHTFLWEGVQSVDSHIYIVCRGTLNLCRYAISSDNPTYLLAARPLDCDSWRGSCTRPKTGIAGSTNGERPLGAALGAERGAQIAWDTLHVGDVLCPLSFIPLSGTEPFTAVAAEGCTLYHAGPREIDSLSQDQRAVFQQAVVRNMSKRLRRLDKSLSRTVAPMTAHLGQEQTMYPLSSSAVAQMIAHPEQEQTMYPRFSSNGAA